MSSAPKRSLVALEGDCFAGKTTLAAQLSRRLNAVAIPEYSDLAKSPPFPPRTHADVRAALDALRSVEIRRCALASNMGLPVVIFDRSPLSCIAFQYGVRCLGVPCDHRLACDVFVAAAQAQHIATPQRYIYIAIDHATANARQLFRGPVAPHLMHPGVIDGMSRAYRHFLQALPSDRRLVLNGARPQASLVEQAVAFVTAPRTGRDIPPAAWNSLKELR